MAYEFELAMKELAVGTLKRAHASFLAGDRESYNERLREAAAAIEGIGKLGISGDNPRFLWVDRLTCDWKLVDAMRLLNDPAALVELYGRCFYPPCPLSLVLDRETRYLPEHCADVYRFYSPTLRGEDELAEQLEHAIALYGYMTGGGGAGVDTLYRAGLAVRRGDGPWARRLIQQAREVAAPWLDECIQTLLRQLDEEESK